MFAQITELDIFIKNIADKGLLLWTHKEFLHISTSEKKAKKLTLKQEKAVILILYINKSHQK